MKKQMPIISDTIPRAMFTATSGDDNLEDVLDTLCGFINGDYCERVKCKNCKLENAESFFDNNKENG